MQKQRTFDHWFNIPQTPTTQKTIFFFNSATMTTSWLVEKPLNAISLATIKWQKILVTLCTDFLQESLQIPPETQYNEKAIPFLKSNLQKCIRRGLNNQAIKTSYHLIKLNINEFLRRISIITIEDVTLHESYSTIIWLMTVTSSKTIIYKTTKTIVDFLLGYVNALCNIKIYDDYDYDSTKYNLTLFQDYDLLLSLQLRLSYGGMKSDMQMLNYISKLWLDKFSNGMKCNCDEIISINSNEVTTLGFREWKINNNCVGIDYHCAPYIVSELMKKHNYGDKKIKSIIWNCSSRINYRKSNEISQKDAEIWDIIKDDFFELQHNILKKLLS